MVLSVKDYYKAFISKINCDLQTCNNDLATTELDIKLYITTIHKHSNQLLLYYGLRVCDLKTISCSKLTKLHEGIKDSDIFYKDVDSIIILKAVIVGLITLKAKVKGLGNDIKLLNSHIMPYTIYKQILVTYNNDVCDNLLQGHTVNIGNGFGKLFVKIIKGKSAKDINSINWKESFNINKNIKDKSQHVYVKSDVQYYPFIGWKGRGSLLYKYFYKFQPNTDNNTGKTSDVLLQNISSLQDIDNLNIGLVRKVSLYLKFKPTHIANYLINHGI